MADYRSIPDAEVQPDAPVTSDLAYALRDNPTALAEGAVGAPKIESGALNMRQGSGNRDSAGTLFTVNNVERISQFLVMSNVFALNSGSSGNAIVRYRTSTNGGSTWSGYTDFDSVGTGSGGGSNDSTKFGIVNIPAAVNTLQFDLSGTASTVRASVAALGIKGVTP